MLDKKLLTIYIFFLAYIKHSMHILAMQWPGLQQNHFNSKIFILEQIFSAANLLAKAFYILFKTHFLLPTSKLVCFARYAICKLFNCCIASKSTLPHSQTSSSYKQNPKKLKPLTKIIISDLSCREEKQEIRRTWQN